MRRWFIVIASLAIVLTLVRAAGFREVGDAWRAIEPRGILLSVACYYAAIAVRIATWRRLLGDASPPLAELAPPLALGFVLGHVTPAKSGDPVTAVLVARSFGLSLPRTLSALTAERAVQGLVLLATFVPAALLSAGDVLEVRGAAGAAAVLLAAAVLGALFAGPLLRRLRAPALRLPRIGPAAAEYLDALAALLARPQRVVPLLALATLFWAAQYASLWAILGAGGASVNLAGAAAVAGAAIIGGTLTMLPLGTQDGISAVVLAGLGVPMAAGFSLALFHTLLSLGCGLVLVAAAPLLARRRA